MRPAWDKLIQDPFLFKFATLLLHSMASVKCYQTISCLFYIERIVWVCIYVSVSAWIEFSISMYQKRLYIKCLEEKIVWFFSPPFLLSVTTNLKRILMRSQGWNSSWKKKKNNLSRKSLKCLSCNAILRTNRHRSPGKFITEKGHGVLCSVLCVPLPQNRI